MKDLPEFLVKYEARVEPIHERRCRAKLLNLKMWSESDNDLQQTMHYDEIKCVQIVMPEDRFRALIENDHWVRNIGYTNNKHYRYSVDRVGIMIIQHEHECRLRHQYPALQKAWEQYQNTLALCGRIL